MINKQFKSSERESNNYAIRTLPTGTISMNDVRNELKSRGTISLNQKEVRDLAKIPSGRISLNDLRGKSTELKPQDCDYYFETKADFDTRRNQIIKENNNDLSKKTFGFGDGVTSLRQAFEYTKITSVPKMIVARNVTDFSYCFHLTNINTIHEDLFKNCPNAINFFSCFSMCQYLTIVPYNLFDNHPNATDFTYCFAYSTEITSSLPDVWNKNKFPKVTSGTDYALNCTKAANYNQIPPEFK